MVAQILAAKAKGQRTVSAADWILWAYACAAGLAGGLGLGSIHKQRIRRTAGLHIPPDLDLFTPRQAQIYLETVPYRLRILARCYVRSKPTVAIKALGMIADELDKVVLLLEVPVKRS